MYGSSHVLIWSAHSALMETIIALVTFMECAIEHRASASVMKDMREKHAIPAMTPPTSSLQDFVIKSVNAPMTARMQVNAII